MLLLFLLFSAFTVQNGTQIYVNANLTRTNVLYITNTVCMGFFTRLNFHRLCKNCLAGTLSSTSWKQNCEFSSPTPFHEIHVSWKTVCTVCVCCFDSWQHEMHNINYHNHYHGHMVNCLFLDYYCIIGLCAHWKYTVNLSIVISDFAYPMLHTIDTINLNLVDIYMHGWYLMLSSNALNYRMTRKFDLEFYLMVWPSNHKINIHQY